MSKAVPCVVWAFFASTGRRAWVASVDGQGRAASWAKDRERAHVFPTRRAAREVEATIRKGSRAQGIAGVDAA